MDDAVIAGKPRAHEYPEHVRLAIQSQHLSGYREYSSEQYNYRGSITSMCVCTYSRRCPPTIEVRFVSDHHDAVYLTRCNERGREARLRVASRSGMRRKEKSPAFATPRICSRINSAWRRRVGVSRSAWFQKQRFPARPREMAARHSVVAAPQRVVPQTIIVKATATQLP
jgi:hypothetical protein